MDREALLVDSRQQCCLCCFPVGAAERRGWVRHGAGVGNVLGASQRRDDEGRSTVVGADAAKEPSSSIDGGGCDLRWYLPPWSPDLQEPPRERGGGRSWTRAG
jgi:hypothetical protein